MYKITLSPQFSDSILILSKSGDALTINGVQYDFSTLNDGDEIPDEAIDNPNIIGSIAKVNGVINITVIMPYSDENAPDSVRFPEPLLWDGNDSETFNEVQE